MRVQVCNANINVGALLIRSNAGSKTKCRASGSGNFRIDMPMVVTEHWRRSGGPKPKGHRALTRAYVRHSSKRSCLSLLSWCKASMIIRAQNRASAQSQAIWFAGKGKDASRYAPVTVTSLQLQLAQNLAFCLLLLTSLP